MMNWVVDERRSDGAGAAAHGMRESVQVDELEVEVGNILCSLFISHGRQFTAQVRGQDREINRPLEPGPLRLPYSSLRIFPTYEGHEGSPWIFRHGATPESLGYQAKPASRIAGSLDIATSAQAKHK